jgi:hypothetical protein
LLTGGAFLTRFAHVRNTSPTLRGKYLRENIMCMAVPAPPDDVDTTLPEPSASDLPRTTRDRIEGHMAEDRCAACHAYIDPLGFALEGFDQAGRARTHENGLPIDTATEIDGVPVADARGLASFLSESPDVMTCLVRNLFRHAVGHIEEVGEEPSLVLTSAAFEAAGFRLQDALVEIVVSDAFLFIEHPEDAP